jgi:hypothetical protein
MKIILILTLSLWSLISSAQLDKTNVEVLPADVTFKTDTAPIDIHSDIAIDSSQQKPLNYKIWGKFSLFEIGFGSSSIKSDLQNNKTQYSGFVQTSFIPFSIGFYSLGGLGFGTKVAEYFDLQELVELSTCAPIYTYYPIYISKKKHKKAGLIPSMVNLYAGGSLWCDTSGSSSSPEIMRATKYFHLGINYMFFNYSMGNYAFGNGNFSIDAGMLLYETKGSNLKNSFHIGLLYNFAGFVVKSN